MKITYRPAPSLLYAPWLLILEILEVLAQSIL